jgi:hypothetical protein
VLETVVRSKQKKLLGYNEMTRADAIEVMSRCHQCEVYGPSRCGTHHDCASEHGIAAADIVFDTGTWTTCAAGCRCRWCIDNHVREQDHLPDTEADGVALLQRHRELVLAGALPDDLRLRQLAAEIRDRLTRPWPGVAVVGAKIEPDPIPAPLTPEQRERRRVMVQRLIARNKA